MDINKMHYKQLCDIKKIYFDMSTVELREMLNSKFKTPTAEDDLTGIFGKYYKAEKIYKVKYIYTRNNQLQPQTYDRYYYLLNVLEDEKGTFLEYVLVYDKLYDPLIRAVYILAVFAVLTYLYYVWSNDAMSTLSASVLAVIVAFSTLLVFRKVKESAEEASKAEQLLLSLLNKE